MQRTPLVTDNYYHVYNRGVEKRIIFLDEQDYSFFVHCLYEFNDIKPAIDTRWQPQRTVLRVPRDPIVDIVAWCLMPNHFHLLLRQRTKNGISFFMKKLGTGYAMYFNKKYQRSGILFQGRFKSVHVHRDEYLLHLIRYIHLNPIDLIVSDWESNGVSDWLKTNQFLETYRWSSYLDWIGKKNFPSLLGQTIVQKMFTGSEDHRLFVQAWLGKDREEIMSMMFD